MLGPKMLFLLLLSMCGPCVVVGTGYVLLVELPVQRRLCPIFVSSDGLPDIHEYSVVDGLSRGMRCHSLV